MWYRIFAANDAPLPPTDLLSSLRERGFPITGHFRGDDDGWFHALLTEEDGEPLLEIQRYRSDEEGIRRELNSWAAWIEETLGEEKGGPWMARLIASRQVITMRPADGAEMEATDELSRLLCVYLAAATDGLYQIDGAGLFAADGSRIAAEIL
ncbi:MAG: hypothetical protein U0793_06465 [Gemmataceae bacterium]